MRGPRLILALLAVTIVAATSTPTSIAQMRWKRRVLVISAPSSGDRQLATQRTDLDRWRSQAADRDLSTVEIVGENVTGALDSAAAVRSRYCLPKDAFEVVLIGKDGGVADRSHTPITGDQLQAAIDAMPMRRNGGR
jgi:hypothetical protein